MKFAYLIEPPFNFRDEDGTVRGCDVELAQYVFAALGIDRYELVETEFSQLLPGLCDGRWQMTTGLFATGERKKYAVFSRPIWALPDGLLIRGDADDQLAGYGSIANAPSCKLAVVRDQFQHRSAIQFGIPDDRILVFETYEEAARAVLERTAIAYASVDRAHSGFIQRNPGLALKSVVIPPSEKAPAFGCFAFPRLEKSLISAVDKVLNSYLGSPDHRSMMRQHGFSDDEVDLLRTG